MSSQVSPSKRRRGTRLDVVEGKLAAVRRNIASGRTVADSCRCAQISVPTYYRWLSQRAASDETRDTPADNRNRMRETVLRSAKALFLHDGFAATLEEVANTAGVARRTVYNLFGSKERLFAEVVNSLYLQHVTPALVFDDREDLPTMLAKSMRYLFDMIYDADAVALYRVTLGEYRNHPQLAKLAYSIRSTRGVPTVVNVIAKRLKTEMALGTIDRIDPHIAAETFVGSFVALPRYRSLAGDKAPSSAEVDERIAIALRIFIEGLHYRSPQDNPALKGASKTKPGPPESRHSNTH